jgi:hypothetical protein
LDEAYVAAIVENSLPHTLNRSKKLKHFVGMLHPGYKLPESRTIKKIQEHQRVDLKSRLKTYIKQNCQVGTLSADGWTCRCQSYFALLLHFIDVETLKPVTVTLGVVRKSKQDAQSLREQTLQILLDWELEDELQKPWPERYFSFSN